MGLASEIGVEKFFAGGGADEGNRVGPRQGAAEREGVGGGGERDVFGRKKEGRSEAEEGFG